MSDFTILCETESEVAASGICELYNMSNILGEKTLFQVYESRNLPENAHY